MYKRHECPSACRALFPHFALHAAERALRLICFFRLDILQFVTEITEHRFSQKASSFRMAFSRQSLIQYYRETAHYNEAIYQWVDRLGLVHIREMLFEDRVCQPIGKSLRCSEPFRDNTE
jgi:hypothetical protein